MSNKIILEPKLPITQSVEAVKSLIESLTGKPCIELPTVFKLPNAAQLTLSSKKDAYYYTTLNSCSCKAGEHHKICRHRRDFCQATREATKRTMLVDAYDPETLPGEIAYWKNKEAAKVNEGLELFGHTAFKPVLE